MNKESKLSEENKFEDIAKAECGCKCGCSGCDYQADFFAPDGTPTFEFGADENLNPESENKGDSLTAMFNKDENPGKDAAGATTFNGINAEFAADNDFGDYEEFGFTEVDQPGFFFPGVPFFAPDGTPSMNAEFGEDRREVFTGGADSDNDFDESDNNEKAEFGEDEGIFFNQRTDDRGVTDDIRYFNTAEYRMINPDSGDTVDSSKS